MACNHTLFTFCFVLSRCRQRDTKGRESRRSIVRQSEQTKITEHQRLASLSQTHNDLLPLGASKSEPQHLHPPWPHVSAHPFAVHKNRLISLYRTYRILSHRVFHTSRLWTLSPQSYHTPSFTPLPSSPDSATFSQPTAAISAASQPSWSAPSAPHQSPLSSTTASLQPNVPPPSEPYRTPSPNILPERRPVVREKAGVVAKEACVVSGEKATAAAV